MAGYAAQIKRQLQGRALTVSLEPGRFLVANGGVLLTRVEYLKPTQQHDARNFAIVDAAMNDLIRPTLYQAWHGIDAVESPVHGGIRAQLGYRRSRVRDAATFSRTIAT